MNYLCTSLISIVMSLASTAFAQSLPGSSLEGAGTSGSDGEVEALYDKDEAKTPPKTEAKPNPSRKAPVDVQNLSDLAKLADFSDVAIIQRRFLPKSNRFEASASAFTNLNNPFFSAYGVDLNLAYYFTERWAIVGIADFAATASRQVTDDLAKYRSITTSNLVTSKGFFGGAVKWNPIYGKITWLNKAIVPFDLNFDVGGGSTQTTDGQNVPTIHFSTSQVFAWTKSAAFKWKFSWNAFQADAYDENGRRVKVAQNDLYLGVGMSFYFPEASYR